MNLMLELPPNQEREAARQCRALMTAPEWLQLVAFALAVVSLQEEVATDQEYLVLPAARR